MGDPSARDPFIQPTPEEETNEPIILFDNEDIKDGIQGCKNTGLEKVLKGNMWTFQNSWMLIKKWDRNEEQTDKGIEEVDIKLQIWGLLEHCKTNKLGKKIAAVAGGIIDCENYEINREHHRFLKATVEINIHKPLQKGVNVGSQ
ncbi:hypothetical protein PIB30_006480 [Stylosanthes scabra]|uniref:DUF4283 domain-containing protein n=1 Tax=Stylosanthes scabra TaxID=79078 RepID=A0ABU6V6U1_9FABA|nr:hypothetical protein [Stylosanthes scabra]